MVCAGDAGINALATVRSLGRRGVPVHVVALQSSAQIASVSRYCTGYTAAGDLASLPEALRALPAGALLYVDNDPMLKALAPHAAELAQRFAVVDPLAGAATLTDKAYQLGLAQKAGIAVPRSWLPQTWHELASLKTGKRLIAKPVSGRADFKALVEENGQKLAAALQGRIGSPADVVVQEFVEGRRPLTADGVDAEWSEWNEIAVEFTNPVDQPVAAGVADQHVTTGATVGAVLVSRVRVRDIVRRIAVVSIVGVQHVVAPAAIGIVAAGPSHDPIVAHVAEDRVIAIVVHRTVGRPLGY